jgi:hypothetical protein
MVTCSGELVLPTAVVGKLKLLGDIVIGQNPIAARL